MLEVPEPRSHFAIRRCGSDRSDRSVAFGPSRSPGSVWLRPSGLANFSRYDRRSPVGRTCHSTSIFVARSGKCSDLPCVRFAALVGVSPASLNGVSDDRRPHVPDNRRFCRVLRIAAGLIVFLSASEIRDRGTALTRSKSFAVVVTHGTYIGA